MCWSGLGCETGAKFRGVTGRVERSRGSHSLSHMLSTIWLHRSPVPAFAGMSTILVLQCFASCS